MTSMSETKTVPANLIPFQNICSLFEQLQKKKKHNEQDEIIINFIHEFRSNVSKQEEKKDPTFYPILRLLLPSLERERGAYNLKETKLGAILVKALSLNKQSKDAQKLVNYRSAANSSQESDFASTAYFILKNRITQISSNCTIGDVNSMLDKISSAETGSKAAVIDGVFTNAMKSLSPAQLKWFLRIILKDLRIGMSVNRILAAYHPDAPEHYKLCKNLSKVCEELEDGDSSPPELGLRVFFAVSPMLSERLDVTCIRATLTSEDTYYVETKFDGERFQIHMENGVFEYFSRKGYSYGNHYGKSYDSGQLTPLMKGCFDENIQSFVFDGEMMGWHKEHNCFGSKGMAYDVKKLTDKSKYRPCFCAFDLLYYNGKSLVGPPEKGGLSLSKRLNILDKMFEDIPGVIVHSKRQIIQQIETNYLQVLDILNKAIENQDEGIVVKNANSHYIVNKRNLGWYKIKPEYTDSAITDLDLVVIGADEAENKRQGRAKSFHVAVVDIDSSGACNYLCAGRVSSGLSYAERERICSLLESRWTRSSVAPPPLHLHFNKETPDFWILPEDSLVFQVRASELIRSASYATAYTLRFPRVMCVRDDKPSRDCATLHDFNQLVADKGAVVKLGTKRIDEDQIEDHQPKVKKKRSARVVRVADKFRQAKPADGEGAPVVSQALRGRSLCVLSDDEDCKTAELIRIIESHGGKHTDNVTGTWCCVVGQLTYRTRAILTKGELDVVSTAWLRSLPCSTSPVCPAPLDMMSISKNTKLRLRESYDPFGDSYTEPVDEGTLKRIFERMDKEEPNVYLLTSEIRCLDNELFGGDSPHSFLRGCYMHFSDSVDFLIMARAKMYGAKICPVKSRMLTHVILTRTCAKEEVETFKRELVNVPIVHEEWVENCVISKELLPTKDYEIFI